MLKQITDFPGNNQLLYFTSPSLARGGKQVCYTGGRTGHPNLYTLNLETGEERQLTFQSEGMLRSYVYFDGQPFRGLGKASVSLDVAGGLLYYLQGQAVRRVSLEGEGRSRDDWACHEMWEKDGRHVIYHGGYRDNGPSFVGRVDTGI